MLVVMLVRDASRRILYKGPVMMVAMLVQSHVSRGTEWAYERKTLSSIKTPL
jgi:hypothetical protein